MAAELFTAIKGGDKAAVERLLERDRTLVDARNEQGLSPILAALYRSEDDIAAAILRRGPKLTVFEAAAAGDAARVRQIVGRDRGEATAVGAVDIEIVRMLLAAGADPNAKSQSGSTPLHTVGFTGDREGLDLLMRHGADLAIKNNDGKTAAEIARERGHGEIAERLASRVAR